MWIFDFGIGTGAETAVGQQWSKADKIILDWFGSWLYDIDKTQPGWALLRNVWIDGSMLYKEIK